MLQWADDWQWIINSESGWSNNSLILYWEVHRHKSKPAKYFFAYTEQKRTKLQMGSKTVLTADRQKALCDKMFFYRRGPSNIKRKGWKRCKTKRCKLCRRVYSVLCVRVSVFNWSDVLIWCMDDWFDVLMFWWFVIIAVICDYVGTLPLRHRTVPK